MRRNEAEIAIPAGRAVFGPIATGLSRCLTARFAAKHSRILGACGPQPLRFSAIVLTCTGIEFPWSGYAALAAVHASRSDEQWRADSGTFSR